MEGEDEEREEEGSIELALLPFDVSFEGDDVQSDDVVVVLEEFLSEKLSSLYPTLAEVVLDHTSKEQNVDERVITTYFSGGVGKFMDPNGIPSKKHFQDAQKSALEDVFSLQRFVNSKNYYWIADPTDIKQAEAEEEGDQIEEADGKEYPTANALEGGSEEGQPKEGDKRITIILLSVGSVLLIIAILVVRRSRKAREGKQEESGLVSSIILRKRRLESKSKLPSSKTIDMCGNIEERSPSGRMPRGRSQISSQGMEIASDGEMMEAGAWR